MTPFDISSLIISIISLLLALYASISTYYEKHRKTKVYLRWVHHVSDRLNVSFLISNMSSRPSTITNIYLKKPSETIESTWAPSRLLEIDDPSTKEAKYAYSDWTPLNIPPRASQDFVISFLNIQSANPVSETMTFVFTVDGKDKEFKLPLKKVLNNKELEVYVQNKLLFS